MDEKRVAKLEKWVEDAKGRQLAKRVAALEDGLGVVLEILAFFALPQDKPVAKKK